MQISANFHNFTTLFFTLNYKFLPYSLALTQFSVRILSKKIAVLFAIFLQKTALSQTMLDKIENFKCEQYINNREFYARQVGISWQPSKTVRFCVLRSILLF